MSTLLEILRGLVALFIDDELLAAGVLCVVAVSALLSGMAVTTPLVIGAVLLCGNLLVLVIGVARTSRRRKSK